mgnify:CR=1 FL=1
MKTLQKGKFIGCVTNRLLITFNVYKTGDNKYLAFCPVSNGIESDCTPFSIKITDLTKKYRNILGI